ncbi:unnamed protein product [Amoebophrya sp. A120]|nr:unnamed protein product [Amoebophrya sp. A120]|eukprot:GSA120T00010769001.1
MYVALRAPPCGHMAICMSRNGVRVGHLYVRRWATRSAEPIHTNERAKIFHLDSGVGTFFLTIDCQKTCQENVQKMGLEERRQLFDCIFKVNTSYSDRGQISNENTTSTSSTSPGSVSKGSTNRSSCVGILPHQTDAAKQLFMEKQELLRQRYLKLEQQCDSVCGKKFAYILAEDGDGGGAVNKKGGETSLAHAKNAGA